MPPAHRSLISAESALDEMWCLTIEKISQSVNFAGKWHGFFGAIFHAPGKGACGVPSMNIA
jgi:hypothetical protein